MFSCISKVKPRIANNFYVFSLALPFQNREKNDKFSFHEMIKACPLINKFETKNSWGSIHAPFKVAQNLYATSGL